MSEPKREAPLAGIRVLDLSRVLAGPYCGLLLSQLGAEIIKVEDPEGDRIRTIPPFLDWLSTYFLSLNHNKKSISFDLKRPEARELFLALADTSDVVLENFRPGVMDRLGIGHEVLSRRNPRIITCSISGYGQTTSWRDASAYDLTIQAVGGLMSITGEPGGAPVRCGYPIGDLGGGVFATIAILAALHERQRSGRGQAIDLALLDVQMSLMSYIASAYLNTGEQPEPVGSGHPAVVPYRIFYGSDRKPFVVAVFNEAFWRNLCSAIARSELSDDPRFRTNLERIQNRTAIESILEAEFAKADRDTWLARLNEADVPCAPINSIAEATQCPPLVERGMIDSCLHPGIGPVRFAGSPIQFGAHAAIPSRPAPTLGEHTEEILHSILGLNTETIARLRESGAVRSTSPEAGSRREKVGT
ncbi:MAG: CaiB/BaiF CoA transferase family protein [Candidatus Binatia bacterium]